MNGHECLACQVRELETDLAALRLQVERAEAERDDSDGERCDCCGRSYLTVWWCGDRDNGALWAQVYEKATGQQRGEAGLLCPQCADKAARELGITLRWVAMTYWAKTTELEQAREAAAAAEERVAVLEGALASCDQHCPRCSRLWDDHPRDLDTGKHQCALGPKESDDG
jgi:hypothetical protein